MDLQEDPLVESVATKTDIEILKEMVGHVSKPLLSQGDKLATPRKIQNRLQTCSQQEVKDALHKKKDVKLGPLLHKLQSGSLTRMVVSF